MDRIESSHQQAIVAGPVNYCRYGYNDQSLRRCARPGVLFDSELTTKKHIAKVAAVCFFHIRRLRQIRRVGKDVNHPPCVGFDNAAVGQLQVATRCSRACRSRLLSRYRECRTSLLGLCLTYVIVTMSPSSDATALAACQFTSAV